MQVRMACLSDFFLNNEVRDNERVHRRKEFEQSWFLKSFLKTVLLWESEWT